MWKDHLYRGNRLEFRIVIKWRASQKNIYYDSSCVRWEFLFPSYWGIFQELVLPTSHQWVDRMKSTLVVCDERISIHSSFLQIWIQQVARPNATNPDPCQDLQRGRPGRTALLHGKSSDWQQSVWSYFTSSRREWWVWYILTSFSLRCSRV